MDYDDTIIFDEEEDSEYPWKGAAIAGGIAFVSLFGFIIPWIIGWAKILIWIF
jgi:hypothetical protein